MLRPTELGLAEMRVAAEKKKMNGKKAKVRGAYLLWLLERNKKLEQIERIYQDHEIYYSYGSTPLNQNQIKWILEQAESL